MISLINIKKVNKLTATIFLLLFIFVPVFTYAVEDPVTAGKTGITYQCLDGNCTFQDLIVATKRVTDYGAVFTLMFSVVVIAFAGFKYMISGDVPGERKKANEMLRKVAMGIGFILAAWLIITLITNALLEPGLIRFGM